MNNLILDALQKAVEQYPEIRPYLKGYAAKLADEGVDWHTHFEPYEGDDVGVIEPDDWVVTQEDIDRAVQTWDELMPEYEGLLDAEVEDDNA